MAKYLYKMINVPIIIFPIIDCVIYHLGRDAFRLSISTDQNQRSSPARSDKSIGLCTATIQLLVQVSFVVLTFAAVVCPTFKYGTVSAAINILDFVENTTLIHCCVIEEVTLFF